MLRNYIKIAIRNILKHRFYSILNVIGLASGLAAVLFIGLYVTDELSYDRFQKDINNLYRVILYGKIGEQEVNTVVSSAPIAPALKNEVPGVSDATRLWPRFNRPIRYKDLSVTIEKVFLADSNFFSFFSFPLLEGDPKTALKEPNSIVLTTQTAKQLFGNEPALGKVISMPGHDETYTVTGVAAEPPHNSSIQFVMLISFSSSPMMTSTQWMSNNLYTFYRKYPDARVADIDSELEKLTIARAGKEIEKMMNISYDEFIKNGGRYTYTSFPFADTHLHANGLQNDMGANSDIKNIYVLGSIGLFILLIACINFMNLSTARSANRAKEVGLRKTLGSSRSVLAYQFLGESFIYALVSVLIAMLMVAVLMPRFNVLSGKQFLLSDIVSSPFLISALVLVIVVGFLAGSYPSLYLTSFKPVEVLKGKFRSASGNKQIRSGLVVFQFSISIFLIISTAVVLQQLRYMEKTDIGIDRFNVLMVENSADKGDALKKSVLQESNVVAAGFCDTKFPGTNNVTLFREFGKSVDHICVLAFGDADLKNTLKFTLLEGRYFSGDSPADSSAAVVNESALKEFGWTPDDALGQRINVPGNGNQLLTVIGVVKDFNFEGFRLHIRPLILGNGKFGQLYIRYTGDSKDLVARMQSIWKEVGSTDPLQYSFLDQNFNNAFKEEQRLSAIFNVFTVMAILVSCLGLFGLASYTAEQRTREIGIRKVMGASVTQVSATLSREFLVLVGIAFVLAVLPAWLFLANWLDDFEYHIDLSVLVFVLGGVIAALIATLTVGYQSLKAARTNPVDALRYE